MLKVQYLGDQRDREAHIEAVDEDPERLFTGLCGVGLWENNRLDTPNGRSLCTLCGEIAYDEFYDLAGIRQFFPSYSGGAW